MSEQFDVVGVGAGTAGIPTAIEAADGGARVLLIEKDRRLGGTLHTTGGHVVAAGTKRQAEHGIEDTPEAWIADIRRITRDGYRPDIIDPVVEHATEFVDWLDEHGFKFAPETPRIVYGHEPYTTPRTYYGPDAGVSILDVLTPVLDEHVAAGRVTVWTDAPAIGLIQDDDDRPGAVTGVHVLHRGKDVEVYADAVVLATGGFAANPEMFEELEGYPLVSGAHPTSTGDGLVIAKEAGAAYQGQGLYLPAFGGLPHPTTPGRVQWEERPVLTQERPPWEIYVDRHGKRWVAEDEPSIDAKERALVAETDDLTFWTILDDQGVQESVPLVVNWSPDDVRAKANVREGVNKADTLAELAAIIGVDEAGLLETVAKYNEYVDKGEDPDFGRTFLPARIEKGPFYAMRNHGVSLLTFIGIDVDGQMRVRREDGSIIEGLYAVGEAIGGAATTGQSFCSGMMITPGAVHGRLLGRRLAAATQSS